jgi:AmiR/NasT family two-component response regulator
VHAGLAAAMENINTYRSTAQLAHDTAEAMRTRAAIEQAKGMLMAEKHISTTTPLRSSNPRRRSPIPNSAT